MSVILSMEQNVSNWLLRDRKRRITERAVRRAYVAFAARHPRLANSLFDEYFVIQHLLPLLRDGATVRPMTMARAWTDQLHYRDPELQQRHARELAPLAAEFLALLRRELSGKPTAATAVERG